VRLADDLAKPILEGHESTRSRTVSGIAARSSATPAG
jgi:hypothetical protein